MSYNLDEPFEDPYADLTLVRKSEPIDVSRSELPPITFDYKGRIWPADVAPVVWVAVKLVAVVGFGNATVIPEVVAVSRDREALVKLAAKDHAIVIELAEVIR